jgi:type IV secretion system protein TrbB
MNEATYARHLQKLRKDFGPAFLRALEDPSTVEIFLNADGVLWQERLGCSLEPISTIDHFCAESAMRTLAAYHDTTLTIANPSIECELPLDGSRFAGQIPPIVSAPVFCVRKRASRVFTLKQYVSDGIMTKDQMDELRNAIQAHRNILVTGSTGSGKTTVLNALIHELTAQFPLERLIIIEDTAEIQCVTRDFVQYHTSPERSMTDLVRMSMRMRPDRILVGEVRGAEALDLLMAWSTGHKGGMGTLHANSAAATFTRLETLVSMNPNAPHGMIEKLIGESLDIIVHIERHPEKGRIVKEILKL